MTGLVVGVRLRAGLTTSWRGWHVGDQSAQRHAMHRALDITDSYVQPTVVKRRQHDTT